MRSDVSICGEVSFFYRDMVDGMRKKRVAMLMWLEVLNFFPLVLSSTFIKALCVYISEE